MPHKVNKSAPKRPESTTVRRITKTTKTQVDDFGPLDLHKVVQSRNVRQVRAKRQAPKVTLRKSLQPGTVCIILMGKYEGRRVVLLKQLPRTQALLVAGPASVNGVPLHRINHKYVIATSTTVDVSGVNVSAINDDLFDRPEGHAYNADDAVKRQREQAVKDQTDKIAKTQEGIESSLVAAISKVDMLKEYLAEPFTLRNGDFPHLMKF
uniref:60S ribosomal protein L6 n=1 Tax=Percolomonas cosmopolitus TaxID=63605 RepID=A0A7S1KMG4_9EUKA